MDIEKTLNAFKKTVKLLVFEKVAVKLALNDNSMQEYLKNRPVRGHI
jgi:hypothetical protein